MRVIFLPIVLLSALSAGLAETARLKARERELTVFCDALSLLKSAAAYTAEDLIGLLRSCRENEFVQRIDAERSLPEAWKSASEDFFTHPKDRALSVSFIEGYGKTDLSGQIAYFTLFEGRASSALDEAKKAVREKGKLYTVLGLFLGCAAVLVML